MVKNDIKILIAEDEDNIRLGLEKILSNDGYRCLLAEDGLKAYKLLLTENIDIIISDIKMPNLDGLQLLEKVNKLQIPVPIIFITGHGTIETAVNSIQKGAYDFMIKPIDIHKLENMIEKLAGEITIQVEQRKNVIKNNTNKKALLGDSLVIKNLTEKIKHLAPSSSNIYIFGESGTGKEVVCDMLHYYDDPKKPLIKLNCAALSENLLESELFGHEKGAFTGAIETKVGRFESANGGSIFLDEISEISMETQVKLLRVLQEKKIERVGSSKSIDVDIRIICGSNKDLFSEMKKGNFREDLFYRLNVIDIVIPPLRERKEDIILIARYFFGYFSEMNHKKLEIDSDVYEKFKDYSWPGNIRELQNVIEKLVVLNMNEKIKVEDLPHQILNKEEEKGYIEIPYGMPLKQVEEKVLLANLKYYNNNKSKLANELQIARKTIQRKLKEYGFQEDTTE